MHRWLICALLGVLCNGCTSYGAAAFLSRPNGAEVVDLRDDTLLGTTPFRHCWDDREGARRLVSVRFFKPGYQSRVMAFTVEMRHGSRADAYLDAQGIEVELQRMP